MYTDSRTRMGAIGLKRPETLGLDTSLAQVALSLARRAPTPWAERDPKWARTPRPTSLDHLVPDSKPAAWWNLKYKTRFLSDASVISGNPIFTNFLWNEIGRGVDLPELVSWLENQSAIVEELTTAVFATQAPKWGDYLDASSISIERAKRGEKIFNANCNHCHGTYDKAWAMENFLESALPMNEKQIRAREPVGEAQDRLAEKLRRAEGVRTAATRRHLGEIPVFSQQFDSVALCPHDSSRTAPRGLPLGRGAGPHPRF
ncbi:MAG: cytochrome c [Proteobacteria bacterium]|nr:cytochrome c [Pseudomonadota bacterium]